MRRKHHVSFLLVMYVLSLQFVLFLRISIARFSRWTVIKKPPVCLCLSRQYPPGYLAAMANKTKKEACARPGRGGRSKHYGGRGRPRRQRKMKEKEENDEEEEEEFPVGEMQEDEPQSNGEQKTTGDSGGCFTDDTRCCEKRTGENSMIRETSVR